MQSDPRYFVLKIKRSSGKKTYAKVMIWKNNRDNLHQHEIKSIGICYFIVYFRNK